MRKEYDFSKAKKGMAIASPGKRRITIMLDDDIIEYFRALAEKDGTGYQTRINAVLRSVMLSDTVEPAALTLDDIRTVLREELNAFNIGK